MREKPGFVAVSVILLLNVVAFVSFWLVSFALIQLAYRFLGGWPATEIAQVVGCTLGVGIALRLKARVTAYFLAGMVAFSVSELVIHSFYGIRAAQGAPTHFAVMGAAVLGIVFGAFLSSHLRRGSTPLLAENAGPAFSSSRVASAA